ncbi:RlpA-like double-psi beta-barrel-protein domain-containing protein-containing protein [Obelidium mucronatum]|nr:RlpA-like double-psi beta-barrel-protein domain-containing protein-containing protein [Obelidium mucronatum]
MRVPTRFTTPTLLLLSCVFLIGVNAGGSPPVYNDTAAVIVRPIMHGEGTYYNTEGGYGACGSIVYDSELIVAVSQLLYDQTQPKNDTNPNHAKVCGRCVQITGLLGTIKAKVMDRCVGCKFYDLDMTPTGFQKIGLIAKGRIPISWQWCDNGPVLRPLQTTTSTRATTKKTTTKKKLTRTSTSIRKRTTTRKLTSTKAPKPTLTSRKIQQF